MKPIVYSKAPLESLAIDNKVIEEVIQKLSKEEVALHPSLKKQLVQEGLHGADFNKTLESIGGGKIVAGEMNILEAIILAEGRPPLFVKNDQYEIPKVEELKNRLAPYQDKLNTAIKSVARIDVSNHPNFDYFGTAWMIDEDIMITNRHVAGLFAYRHGHSFYIRTDPFGKSLNTKVDFREEYQQSLPPIEIRVKSVLHIEPAGSNHPDVAILQVERDRRLPDPIKITANLPLPFEDISVIGYPAKDGFRNDASIMRSLFGDIYQVKRLSPGKVAAVLDDHFIFAHDCTTLGGSSGSVVIRNLTGEALGLHFGGSFMENNFAVTGHAILNLLGKVKSSTTVNLPMPHSLNEEAPPTAKELKNRKGYNPDFLGEKVPLPDMIDGHQDIVAPLVNSSSTELKYLHFSVKLHKKRKMAIYTACNIDGSKWFHIPRATDRWYFDPRIDREYQAGNDLYKWNNLQRGHLVRRLDPAWGDSRAMAVQGIEDTFYWTNCTPQHEKFNPRSWLRLEEYVLDNAINHDLKVSVFTGPVFRHRDKRYRGHQIPQDYWKILTFMNMKKGRLSATSYLLSQSEFMDDLEFAYGAYKTYQVPIQKIINLTNIDFDYLKQYDPLSINETLSYLEIFDNTEMIL